jgi:hypothetical protein
VCTTLACCITWALSDARFHIRRPHNEISAGVDEHTMAWPLVQDDEFATPDHRVLLSIHRRSINTTGEHIALELLAVKLLLLLLSVSMGNVI